MGHIFVSYSSKDRREAKKLIAQIENAGYGVWVDVAGLVGGDRWTTGISTAIREADAFLLLLSPNSAGSPEVEKEVGLAGQAHRKILPVILKGAAQIPAAIEFHLANLQMIDLVRDKQGVNKLIDALGGHKEKEKERVRRGGLLRGATFGLLVGFAVAGVVRIAMTGDELNFDSAEQLVQTARGAPTELLLLGLVGLLIGLVGRVRWRVPGGLMVGLIAGAIAVADKHFEVLDPLRDAMPMSAPVQAAELVASPPTLEDGSLKDAMDALADWCIASEAAANLPSTTEAAGEPTDDLASLVERGWVHVRSLGEEDAGETTAYLLWQILEKQQRSSAACIRLAREHLNGGYVRSAAMQLELAGELATEAEKPAVALAWSDLLTHCCKKSKWSLALSLKLEEKVTPEAWGAHEDGVPGHGTHGKKSLGAVLAADSLILVAATFSGGFIGWAAGWLFPLLMSMFGRLAQGSALAARWVTGAV